MLVVTGGVVGRATLEAVVEQRRLKQQQVANVHAGSDRGETYWRWARLQQQSARIRQRWHGVKARL